MKKLLCVMIAALMVLSLAACGGSSAKASTPEKTVGELMEAIKTLDTEKIASISASGTIKISGFEEIPDSTLEVLKSWASKLSYSIENVETNEISSTVKVAIKHADSTPVIKLAIDDYIQKVVSMTLSGEAYDQDKLVSMLYESIDEMAAKTETDTAETEAEVGLVLKDGTWMIDTLSSEFTDVATSNMITAAQSILAGN